jgi:very-short-patch-repair endonuclease
MNKLSKLSKFKKTLRSQQTAIENILWYNLRNRYLKNAKFRRQHILCDYIVDFVCLEQKLIIELDGSQHAENAEYDKLRTEKLESDGFRVIRFWNNEVVKNLEGVLEEIYNNLEDLI